VKVALIDYQAGNLRNVQKAIERLGRSAIIVTEGEGLREADLIILPGVGAFGEGMDHLRRSGFVDVIRERVHDGVPILGICLGMQLLGTSASEGGRQEGLGLINMSSPRFRTEDTDLRVPHIGWNEVEATPGSRLFQGVPSGGDFYFGHSFHVKCVDPSDVAGWCTYGYPFAAAVEKRNVFGTQFHPEKSQRYGLAVLANFFGACDGLIPHA
jgi:imidazole glycerol-phosphate synthase subunit HisH